MIRTFNELLSLPTFEERFEYLQLNGQVAQETFGFDRYMNQKFYRSAEWKSIRRDVIARDNGCDLAISGHEIHDKVIIHHMNPMRRDDLIEGRDRIVDPNYLISVTLRTHNAIHYGDKSLLIQPLIDRKPGDTKLW